MEELLIEEIQNYDFLCNFNNKQKQRQEAWEEIVKTNKQSTGRGDKSTDSAMNVAINSKRALYNEPCCSKKQGLAHSEENACRLTTLPEDILLVILSYVPHDSLLYLKETCTLFARICEDFTLWRNVDCTKKILTAQDLLTIRSLVTSETISIKIGSCEQSKPSESVTAEWLANIKKKCGNLKYLGLISQRIYMRTEILKYFPTNLSTLDLSGTTLKHFSERKVFYDISVFMPYLKILNLTDCEWFDNGNMAHISACKQLEELILTGCKLDEYSHGTLLEYSRYLDQIHGFRSLRTLDIRRCFIDSPSAFYFLRLPTLKNFYYERFFGVYDSAKSSPEWLIDNIVNTKVERLVYRDVAEFTDAHLLHLDGGVRNLKFLDVTGCLISLEGAIKFKRMRPHVTIVNELRPFSL